MNKIKVGDVVTYVHRACSLRTSKIRSIQIIDIQKELQEVNEYDLATQNQDGEVWFEYVYSCCFNQIVSVLGSGCPVGQKKTYSKTYVLGTEAVREYEDAVDNHTKWSVSSLCDCGSVATGSFDTQAELDAYIQGIEDAMGWLEYAEMMTDDQWQAYLAETATGNDK